MRLTRAQNVLRLAGNVQNRVDFWGSAPDPAEGAYDAPSDSLVVRGFLPSAIAASRLRRLQFRVFGEENCFHHSGGIDATAGTCPQYIIKERPCIYHFLPPFAPKNVGFMPTQ